MNGERSYRLGVGSYTWSWAVGNGTMSALDIIARAEAHGLDCVQLCNNLPFESLQNLSENLPETSLVLEMGTQGLANLANWLPLAERFGSPLLRFVIDLPEHHPSAEEVIEALRPYLPRLEAQKTVLAIENHDRFPARTLAQIVETLNSQWVGICLDTANSLGAGEGLETVLDVLSPYTVCLHLKDISIRRLPHLMGFHIEGAKPTEGMIDFAQILETVIAQGRCQSVILEQWPPDPACENEWAEAGIAWLKTYGRTQIGSRDLSTD